MSYKLYRVHWKIYKKGVAVEERYSFHKNDSVVAEFIGQVISRNTPEREFRTEGPGNEHSTHDGNLYQEVMNSNKLGIWRAVKEVTTQELITN
jgi:hypothetical protein